MNGYSRAYRDPKSPLTPILPLTSNKSFTFNINADCTLLKSSKKSSFSSDDKAAVCSSETLPKNKKKNYRFRSFTDLYRNTNQCKDCGNNISSSDDSSDDSTSGNVWQGFGSCSNSGYSCSRSGSCGGGYSLHVPGSSCSRRSSFSSGTGSSCSRSGSYCGSSCSGSSGYRSNNSCSRSSFGTSGSGNLLGSSGSRSSPCCGSTSNCSRSSNSCCGSSNSFTVGRSLYGSGYNGPKNILQVPQPTFCGRKSPTQQSCILTASTGNRLGSLELRSSTKKPFDPQLEHLLRKHNVAQYKELFEREEIDCLALSFMRPSDLKRLGIEEKEDIKRLLLVIKDVLKFVTTSEA